MLTLVITKYRVPLELKSKLPDSSRKMYTCPFIL